MVVTGDVGAGATDWRRGRPICEGVDGGNMVVTGGVDAEATLVQGSREGRARVSGEKGAAMEHGSVTDSTASSFSIMEEDHTLANSVRFVLNQE
ncbi:hypothetical protein ABZP36_035819 [Zizania latifolia]